MSIFKCKMCGGTIEFEHGATVGICDSCGTKQTLPRLDDDKKINLYDRANHFRRNNDFDKAMGIYEQILNEDKTDSEAYWSLVLCRYGIEYVEDPSTHKRIPTINRTQFTSIYTDEDYKSALLYADAYQKEIYEREAKEIDEIQKGILAISQREEPFDIFICYKETDNSGRRTQDSVLANDLYHQLTQEGFKVFFSRITLEDKLGTAYEPYIFAALNSSRVMVVLGTKPEYFNAVWVKNEWSRYLALVKNSGGKKTLIPAYKDMDPYDLPEEFSHLQAQDMSKLGFMQDLIRGIKKIINISAPNQAPKETTIAANTASATLPNAAPLLERAFLFLEDGRWQDANAYCEKVLDLEPKNAKAYLGKLMSELRVKNRNLLADCSSPFDDKDNYQKILRFGDDEIKTELRGYITHINERNENNRLNGIYDSAVDAMNSAKSEEEFKRIADQFKSIGKFKDSDTLAEQCIDKAEMCRKNAIYEDAYETLDEKHIWAGKKRGIAGLEESIAKFQSIPGWKDSDELICVCKKKIEKIKAEEEAYRLESERKAEERRIAAEKAKKKKKKIITVTAITVCACIAILIVYTKIIIPNKKYNSAMALLSSQKYDEAIAAFKELDGYRDSDNQLENCYIGKFGEEQYSKIKDTKDAKIGDIFTFGSYEQDNDTSNGKEAIEWIVLDRVNSSLLLISKRALDCKPYNSIYTGVTWENCSLRKWLNEEFLNVAFSAEEQKMIQTTSVPASKNSRYNTDPGNPTMDNVFLLSVTQAEKYFNNDEDSKCFPTNYAKANGALIMNGSVWWWLSSPGRCQEYTVDINYAGSINYIGSAVRNSVTCVRPALWFSLDS